MVTKDLILYNVCIEHMSGSRPVPARKDIKVVAKSIVNVAHKTSDILPKYEYITDLGTDKEKKYEARVVEIKELKKDVYI